MVAATDIVVGFIGDSSPCGFGDGNRCGNVAGKTAFFNTRGNTFPMLAINQDTVILLWCLFVLPNRKNDVISHHR